METSGNREIRALPGRFPVRIIAQNETRSFAITDGAQTKVRRVVRTENVLSECALFAVMSGHKITTNHYGYFSEVFPENVILGVGADGSPWIEFVAFCF